MPNPKTVQQARRTPQWLQWKEAIQQQIAKQERDGAMPVRISMAERVLAEQGDNDIIYRQNLGLRVKTNPDDGTLLKLQVRGAFDGRPWIGDEPATAHMLPSEGRNLVLAEAAKERRIIIRGDVTNAYPKAEWKDGGVVRRVFSHMYSGFERYTEDGELLVYEHMSPTYGAPPAGYCWEKFLNGLICAAGGIASDVIEALFHFHTTEETGRFGSIVDDMLMTVGRNSVGRGLAHHVMLSITDACGGQVKWQVDPVEFSFGGPQIVYNVPAGVISVHVALKIEQAVAKYAPELSAYTGKCEQPASQAALDALVMVPLDQREGKLSGVQKLEQSEIGALMYFVEYMFGIEAAVHRLTCVMSFPPEEPTRAVLDSVWCYAFVHRFSSRNSFGGKLADDDLSACLDYAPLESVPHAERMLMTDATWSGSEERSLKMYAIKYMGGTIMRRVSTIHAIMPSSFMAEADALHEGVEAGNYVLDALVEFGQVAARAMLTLVDNKGLVDVCAEKSKGGSKLHRRKLGIILEQIKQQQKYTVRHCPDVQMPVDYMGKLVSARKMKASIDFLTNKANAVHAGALQDGKVDQLADQWATTAKKFDV